ncbi:hypothetical protein BDY21DRAFT_345588 [Lineolata rhizophorae]|uniref:Uncharacterized protein n=1 Tax=Lineolata rhizophorae TaxID=578093 RepID=A0A6A6NZZ9_9PEZI|nr:hypothetical protein BDY21DRAFT_345588 [Lineolata rhizophorae]
MAKSTAHLAGQARPNRPGPAMSRPTCVTTPYEYQPTDERQVTSDRPGHTEYTPIAFGFAYPSPGQSHRRALDATPSARQPETARPDPPAGQTKPRIPP